MNSQQQDGGGGDEPGRLAEYLDWPTVKVRAALGYAAAYPDEIEAAITDNDRGPEALRAALPGLETVIVDGR